MHRCFAVLLCSTSAITWQRNVIFPKLYNMWKQQHNHSRKMAFAEVCVLILFPPWAWSGKWRKSCNWKGWGRATGRKQCNVFAKERNRKGQLRQMLSHHSVLTVEQFNPFKSRASSILDGCSVLEKGLTSRIICQVAMNKSYITTLSLASYFMTSTSDSCISLVLLIPTLFYSKLNSFHSWHEWWCY